MLVSSGITGGIIFSARLKKINENDVFIASYPKSGNTWIRFLIANMLSDREPVTFRNIENYVPDIYLSADEIKSRSGGRFIKIHHPCFNKFPRFIYIYRDYRDVLVSYYFFSKEKWNYRGDFSGFIRSRLVKKPFGSWKEHIVKALQRHSQQPKNSLVLSFENLLNNPVKETLRIASFCNLSLQKDPYQIAERCSFSELKKMEEQHGNYLMDSKPFFRSGRTGQWKNYFNAGDLKWLYDKDANKELLQKLGYEI